MVEIELGELAFSDGDNVRGAPKRPGEGPGAYPGGAQVGHEQLVRRPVQSRLDWAGADLVLLGADQLPAAARATLPHPAQLTLVAADTADPSPWEAGAGWQFEFKWDGVRAIVRVDGTLDGTGAPSFSQLQLRMLNCTLGMFDFARMSIRCGGGPPLSWHPRGTF